jgi:hypothetical protein
LQIVFCITEGFHPIPFLRDGIHLVELAAINREEAEREERRTSIPSPSYGELSQYWLPDDPMSTPGPQPQPQPQPPTSPIPDDDDSVAIDTGDVDLDESDPTEPTKSSSKRSLDLTEFEGSFKRGVTSALQQRPLFVLERSEINTADAAAFQLQAIRSPDIALADVGVGRAIDLLHICIMGDTTFTMLPDAGTSRWHELLNVVQVAEVVARYFGARPDGGRTLAEYFGNVPFEWCYAHPQYERATAMELPALVQSHERLNGPIPAEQHAHLITLIEKRLNADSQIRTDYFLKRGPKPIAGETWQQALNRNFFSTSNSSIVVLAESKTSLAEYLKSPKTSFLVSD